MISLYFGLPGAGKTTLACKLLLKASNKYDRLFCNFPCRIPGVTVIDNSCIGKYDLSDSFLVIDEAQLFANCRKTDSFSEDMIEEFVLHRHRHMDIAIFSQRTNGHDKIIRELTCQCFYLYKTFPLGFWQTNYYKIPYKVMIPDVRSGSSRVGEILMGYYQPPVLVKLFAHRVWRPNFYRYFDSFEAVQKPSLPGQYSAYYPIDQNKLFRAYFRALRDPYLDPSIIPRLSARKR